MTAKVTIVEGKYRGKAVTSLNGAFELIKDWKDGAKGGFVTVLNNGSLDYAAKDAKVRITVTEDNFDQTGELAGSFTAPNGKQIDEEEVVTFVETDEQTKARIKKTFKYIETLTAAAQKNDIRALIISGPAGVGKSYGVEMTLARMNMQHKLAGRPEKYDMVTGGSSPIGLYIKLWDNRKAGNVLVFDDCDSALFDMLQLNMLKAAMDTKAKRRICWMKESNALKGGGDEKSENIPNAFEFEGSIIFLTNLKFDKFKNKKIGAHLEAIMSRVHYLDLCLDSRREQLLRVEQVVEEGMLDHRNLGKKLEDRVVNYVYDNVDYLSELSLRTVLKVADLAAIDKGGWEDTSDFTVLSHKGRMQKWAKAAAST